MFEINRLEDLTTLGNISKDLLVLSTDGIIKFMNPIKIPYSVKITGDTVFTSAQTSSEVHFVGKKASLTSSASGTSLTLKNICLRSDVATMDIKQNTIDRLVMVNSFIDTPDLGLANFKVLHMTDLRCINPNQKPLEIGSCNSINAFTVSNTSAHPLLELSEVKTVRDQIVVHDFRDPGNGGFISLGIREHDETYLLATIPKRGIMVKRIPYAPTSLLRVIHNGYYAIPDVNIARKYFG